MLDKISFKIMLELCRDGRQSNVKIAQSLGVSIPTVSKKINTMIANNVFTIKATVNFMKIGHQIAAFIGLKIDIKITDSICSQLIKKPFVSLVVNCFGRFDVLCMTYFPDIQSFQDFIKKTLPNMEGISDIQTYMISEMIGKNRKVFPGNPSENKAVNLDKIDWYLIQELVHNGRIEYTSLASELGLDNSTVSRRVNSLVKTGVIEFHAIPNPYKLGYMARAFIVLNADISKTDKICVKLSQYPEVQLVSKLMNDFDILFGINLRDLESLEDFIKTKIASLDGVLSSETFINGKVAYLNTFSGTDWEHPQF